jgi:hypothetical protein
MVLAIHPLVDLTHKWRSVCQDPNSTAQLAAVILRYIRSHPDACDTLQGVTEWWLARQRYEDTRTGVAAALEFLLEQGQAEAAQGADGRVVYRARKAEDDG